jgi:predicted enzyme related to lactoylglutathione lyase
MPTRFTLLSIFVTDLPRMQAFYTERVGLEVVPQLSNPADFIFLNADGTSLALRAASELPPGTQPTVGTMELAFETADIAATRQDWLDHGVEVTSEIFDMGAGLIFTARDPEGNSLSMTQLHDSLRIMRQEIGLDAAPKSRRPSRSKRK